MNTVVPPRTASTLQAVARKAGVSISTASRCLSGAAKMADSTQLRVFAAATAVGYKHNALVGQVMRATRRGEAQNHLGTIAFVTPVADSHEWRATPTLQSNWEAARERAESFGYGITEFTLCSSGMTGQRLGGILAARGITGALLAAFPTESRHDLVSMERLCDCAGGPPNRIATSRLRPERPFRGGDNGRQDDHAMRLPPHRPRD